MTETLIIIQFIISLKDICRRLTEEVNNELTLQQQQNKVFGKINIDLMPSIVVYNKICV
jgi:hypothetical protein